MSGWKPEQETKVAVSQLAFLTRKKDGAAFAAGLVGKTAIARFKSGKAAASGEVARAGAKAASRVSGYAATEGTGPIYLFMPLANFPKARRVLRNWLKSVGKPRAIRLGRDMANGSAEELAFEGGQGDTRPVEADMLAGDQAADRDEMGTEHASDANAAEPAVEQTPPEAEGVAPADDAPARPDLTPDQTKAVEDHASEIAKAAQAIALRIKNARQIDPTDLTRDIETRLSEQLGNVDPADRAAFLDNAPGRLLMQANLYAILGGSDRADAPVAGTPITSDEITRHFMEIGDEVLRAAGRDGPIDAARLVSRIDAIFIETASASDKFEQLEQLSKAMLPALADVRQIERHFAGAASTGPDTARIKDGWLQSIAEAQADYDALRHEADAFLARRPNPIRVQDLGTGWAKFDTLFQQIDTASVAQHLDAIRTGDKAAQAGLRAAIRQCRDALDATTLAQSVPFANGGNIHSALAAGLAQVEGVLAH